MNTEKAGSPGDSMTPEEFVARQNAAMNELKEKVASAELPLFIRVRKELYLRLMALIESAELAKLCFFGGTALIMLDNLREELPLPDGQKDKIETLLRLFFE